MLSSEVPPAGVATSAHAFTPWTQRAVPPQQQTPQEPPTAIATAPRHGGSETIEPGFHAFDVLWGRTKSSFAHAGNVRFRRLIRHYREPYQATRVRHEKSEVVKTIMNYIHANGGRFMRLVDPESRGGAFKKKSNASSDDEKQDVNRKFVWEEANRDEAYNKVGHALRSARKCLTSIPEEEEDAAVHFPPVLGFSHEKDEKKNTAAAQTRPGNHASPPVAAAQVLHTQQQQQQQQRVVVLQGPSPHPSALLSRLQQQVGHAPHPVHVKDMPPQAYVAAGAPPPPPPPHHHMMVAAPQGAVLRGPAPGPAPPSSARLQLLSELSTLAASGAPVPPAPLPATMFPQAAPGTTTIPLAALQQILNQAAAPGVANPYFGAAPAPAIIIVTAPPQVAAPNAAAAHLDLRHLQQLAAAARAMPAPPPEPVRSTAP